MSRRGDDGVSSKHTRVDRELEAQSTIGGPQVYALPDAPSDWDAGETRPSVSDAVDPGRSVDALGNVDALGAAADEQELGARHRHPGDDLAGNDTVSGQAMPLDRTGAADVRGHRYPDRDPGRSRALPRDSGSGKR